MILAILSVFAALTSADAVSIILNSPSAVGPRTYAEAKARVEKEAALGRPLQQFVVGVTTDDKRLAKKYLEASRETVRRLAEKRDDPLAWYLLSVEGNDIEKLRRAASGGNVQALNALGAIETRDALARYGVTSNGTEAVLKRCFEMFGKAAAQCDSNGFINLGACYQRGLGCEQDLEMAFVCFKAAAEAGNPEGMDNVSACYQFGHGVRQDSGLCRLWAMRGRAARGDEVAAQWLKDRR